MAGVESLHAHVAVLVIVDVLSFSTAVDVAASRGAIVYPFPFSEAQAAQLIADRIGEVVARPRHKAEGKFSLSPASLTGIPSGVKLVLPSLNGGHLSVAAGRTPGRIPVLTGCLRNAAAVAAAARALAGDEAIGVVPAGECWPDGSLRPAVEDFLGAGAVIDRLDGQCSPEAQIARDAYRSAGDDIARLIRLSTSGRELVDGAFRGMSIWRWNSGSAQACRFSSMAPIVYRLDPSRPQDEALSIAIVVTHSVTLVCVTTPSHSTVRTPANSRPLG
jgi:2-phosphosulfolactate phosphatase